MGFHGHFDAITSDVRHFFLNREVEIGYLQFMQKLGVFFSTFFYDKG